MGRYYSSQGNNVEAEKNFSRALELSPNDEQTFREVVLFYLQAKQTDRAMEKIAAVSDATKQAFHYELIGMVAEQAGKPQDSENAYKEALKKDPNRLSSETLLFNLSLIHISEPTRLLSISYA